MEEYIELNKCKKQLEYISKLSDILSDENDGGLFDDFTEKEADIFYNFYDFLNNTENKIKNKLGKIEGKIKSKI